MKPRRIFFIAVATLFIQACAEDISLTGPLVPDLRAAPPVDEYPSNDDLAAVNGVPELEQALALIYGTWVTTDDATQCVETFRFGRNGMYSYSGAGALYTGFYALGRNRFGIYISIDRETYNYEPDCFGYIETRKILDEDYITHDLVAFPDQHLLVLLNGVNLPTWQLQRQTAE